MQLIALLRSAAALALVLVLAGCTPGGQFDPTTMFNTDVFDTKTKLKGQREPLFPNGVPGATTGVPADLVKGYQPPPDQSDADADAQGAPAPAAAAKAGAKAASQKPEQSRNRSRKSRSDGRKAASGRRKAAILDPDADRHRSEGRASAGAVGDRAIGTIGTIRLAGSAADRPRPASRAAVAIDLAGSAVHRAGAACGRAIGRTNSQSGQSFNSMWPKPAAGSTSTQ